MKIVEAEKIYGDAQARASGLRNLAEIAKTRVRQADQAVEKYWRDRPGDKQRDLTYVSDVPNGTRPDLSISRPPSDEHVAELEEAARKAEFEAEEAHQQFLEARKAKLPAESKTGWKAGRGMRFNGEWFDAGDPIDPDSIPGGKWERLRGAGFVVPAGRH